MHISRTLSETVVLAGVGTLLAFGLAACKSNPAPIVTNTAASSSGVDPADANMAGYASGQPTKVLGQSQAYTPQQQSESYAAGQQAPAPVVQGYNNNSASNEAYSSAQYAQQGYSGQGSYAQGYADGETAEAATAPPPLPVYDQPVAPDPNDLWTPGYWDYGTGGYYWVPGAWVAAPYLGALWTPPYWGWAGGRYRFHRGYWGQHIGYYGGINYGFGYIGTGYYGGYWHGRDFYYNRAVNRVGPGFGNVYERPVIVNNVRYDVHPTVRVSYNGGPGGINAQPRSFEVAAERERHTGALPAQMAMRQAAVNNRGNFFAANQGRPAQVAFAHPPNAGTTLPANGSGMGRPGEVNRPDEAGRAGFNGPTGVGGPGTANRPGAFAGRQGVTAQGAPVQGGFNRPGEPAGVTNRPGATGGQQPGNRPGERPGEHLGERAGEAAGHNNAPPAGVGSHMGGPVVQPGFNRPGEPGTRPGGFNAPGARPVREAPASRPGADANRGFDRSSPAFFNHPGQPVRTGPVEASRPAPQPRVEMPRTAVAPGPHVETAPRPAPAPRAESPRAAPAPHMEAPRAVPAPAPHVEAPRMAPAPHVEGPHGPPAGGGGHPGPR